MKEQYVQVIREIGELFEAANIPYQFTGQAALSIQQVPLTNYSDTGSGYSMGCVYRSS